MDLYLVARLAHMLFGCLRTFFVSHSLSGMQPKHWRLRYEDQGSDLSAMHAACHDGHPGGR